ncbi:MAG: hypothetical protein AMXMBFR59_13750 [Rhodanobacteraceae bacterium]
MRSIDYESLRGADVCSREHLSIADVLRVYPYLLVGGLIPPLAIVNALLRAGAVDAGMSGGGRWEPIELSLEEFEEVISDLIAHGTGGRPLRYAEPPDWVQSYADWSIWVAEQVYSIPAAENRRYSAAMADLQAAADQAARAGDEEARGRHLLALVRTSAEWNEFHQKHHKPRTG